MKPPKCRLCGKQEWGHICNEVSEDLPLAYRMSPEGPDEFKEKPKGGKSKWVKKNPEKYREYMKTYMRKRRSA